MADVSVLVQARPRHRRHSASWLWSAVLAAAAGTAALTGLDLIGRPGPPPLLRASFVGPSMPDVRLQPVVAAPEPIRRTGPIDVPADPYAPEAVVEIGTIEIPRIGVSQRLMHGVTLRNIDVAPSHWPGSALPGEAGNMVVAGHRVTHSRPFRNIDQLAGGDEVVVTANGTRATYRVATSFVVTPDRTDIANPTGSPVLTLFACHPPGSARQRYVVRADLVAAQAV